MVSRDSSLYNTLAFMFLSKNMQTAVNPDQNNVFTWTKMWKFWLKFHENIIMYVLELIASHHWFRQWLMTPNKPLPEFSINEAISRSNPGNPRSPTCWWFCLDKPHPLSSLSGTSPVKARGKRFIHQFVNKYSPTDSKIYWIFSLWCAFPSYKALHLWFPFLASKTVIYI